MNVAHAAAIWRGMIEIKDRGPSDPSVGICQNLMRTAAVRRSVLTEVQLNRILQVFYPTWDKYSGHYAYPVPAPVEKMNASYAYYLFENKWAVDSDSACAVYGKTRAELFDHIFKGLYDILSENLSTMRSS